MTYRIFVYGTLRSGQSNASLWQRNPANRSRGPATLDGAGLFMRDRFAGFPYLARAAGLQAVGELIEVDRPTLNRLDRLEGIPYHYRRQRARVRNFAGREADAYVYLVPEERVRCFDPVPDGDWVRFEAQRRSQARLGLPEPSVAIHIGAPEGD